MMATAAICAVSSAIGGVAGCASVLGIDGEPYVLVDAASDADRVDFSNGTTTSGTMDASMHAAGTDPTGAVTVVDFSGAATSESNVGVYCKLWPAPNGTQFLEVLGNSSDGLSFAEIKLWNFALSADESRRESFTPTQSTVDIWATLVGLSSGFHYSPSIDPTSGSCTTTISALTGTSVVGTFDCNPLPPDQISNPQSLSMTFACPLQP
jgi:hypothetical protein